MALLSDEEVGLGGSPAKPSRALSPAWAEVGVPGGVIPAAQRREQKDFAGRLIKAEEQGGAGFPATRTVIAGSEAPAPSTAKPGLLSDADVGLGGSAATAPGKSKDPLVETKGQIALDVVMQRLSRAGGEAAAIADLVLGTPYFLLQTGAKLGGAAVSALAGEKDPFKAGRETAERLQNVPILRKGDTPLKHLIDSFSSGEAYKDALTTQGMEKLSKGLEEAGKWVEETTGGRVPRDAVPMFVETLLAGSAGLFAGKRQPIDPRMQKLLRENAQKLRDQAEVEAVTAAEAARTPESAIVQASRVPVQQQINQLLDIKTPAERAAQVRARRKDVKAAFEKPAEGSDYVDIAESQFRAAERMENEARYGRPTEGVVEPAGTAYEVGSSPRPERVGQAEILRILQKPGFERTAEDLITLRKANQEGKASPEALALMSAAGLGAVVGDALTDDDLRGAALGAVTGAAAAAPFMFRGPSVPGMKRQAGAVKAPGGMWHPEAVERLAGPIARKLDDTESGALEQFERDVVARPELGDTLTMRNLQQRKALSGWADKSVRNYLNRYAGTERDPLKDVEIPYHEGTAHWADLWDASIKEIEALGPHGKEKQFTLENPSRGEHIGAYQAISSQLAHVGDYLRQNVDPAKLPQYDLVRAVKETYQNDLRVAKEMEKAAAKATKELPIYREYPDGMKWVELKLPEKLTPEQMKGVRELTPVEMDKFGSKGYLAVGPDGKPIKNAYTQDVARGKTPEEAYLAGRLAEEGNQMGHCVGGYCEGVAAGESRIFSLRDKKGQSHVTVEVEPGKIFPLERLASSTGETFEVLKKHFGAAQAKIYYDTWSKSSSANSPFADFMIRYYPEELSRIPEPPDSILQIKGKQNRAPNAEYLPYVQDFVKEGKWGEVGDLGYTGLVDISYLKDPARQSTLSEAFFRERLGNDPRRYITQAEHDALLAEHEQAMRQGGPGGKQQGFIDQKLLTGLGAVGLGGILGSWMADEPGSGALLGAVAGGALALPGAKLRLKQLANAADYGLGVVSTNVGTISQPLKLRLRKFEHDLLLNTYEHMQTVLPFLRGLESLPAKAKERLNLALLRNDAQAISEIIKGNRELVAGFRQTRNLLQDFGQQLKGYGRLKGLLEDYFPRIVKDKEGLFAAIQKIDNGRVQKLIKDAEAAALKDRGYGLSDLELSSILNRELRYTAERQTLQPGFAKQRMKKDLTEELQQFYYTPAESLYAYVQQATRDLEMAKFFGKELVQTEKAGQKFINLDRSIGELLGKDMAAGKITPEQFSYLEKQLKARFGAGEIATSKLLQDFRNTANMGLLGNPISALTQMGDTLMAAYAHGVTAAATAMAKGLSGKAKLTTKEIGLSEHIAEEFVSRAAFQGSRLGQRAIVGSGAAAGAVAGALLADDAMGTVPGALAGAVLALTATRGTAQALNSMFKYSGFAAVDRIGKNVQLGAALSKYERWAQNPAGRKRIAEKYQESFGDDFPALMADLQAQRVTPHTRLLAFSELSDMQPISKSELPRGYLENPNGRLAYQLKTFMVKQMDVIRRDVWQEWSKGNVAKGTAKLAKYVTILGLADASVQAVKDWILGREVDWDATSVPENVLKTFGWSEYTREQAAKGEVSKALGNMIVPPFRIMDDIIQRDPKAVRYIPIVGKLYYDWELGGQEEAEVNKKRKEKKEGFQRGLSPAAEAFLERRREEAKRRREALQ